MNRYLVVATRGELDLPMAKQMYDVVPIITGVGGVNVIRALANIPKASTIINVGFAGSSYYHIGECRAIGTSKLWHPNVDYEEPSFKIGVTDDICYTSGDFIINGEGLPYKAIVDMELAYICAFNFDRIISFKYISDNFNIDQYMLNHKTEMPMKK